MLMALHPGGQKSYFNICPSFENETKLLKTSSRGGLVVELWTDNSLPSTTVGSNLRQVWCINRSVEETLCYNSNCRTPGPLRGL